MFNQLAHLFLKYSTVEAKQVLDFFFVFLVIKLVDIFNTLNTLIVID